MKSFPLASLADVSTGVTLRGADAARSVPDGNVCLLKIGDLREDGRFDLPEPAMIRLDPSSVERYQIHPEDVLIASRGSRATAAIYEGPLPAVAGSQFYVIRPHLDRLLPDYLHWYLNRPEMQTTLMDSARGSYVQAIPVDVVRQLSIPVPPLDVQRRLCEIIHLQREEARLTQLIAEKRALLLRHQLQAIATGQIRPQR